MPSTTSSNGDPARGVRLRIEEQLDVADALAVRPAEIAPRQFGEIVAGEQHGHGRVVEVEERLQVVEVVLSRELGHAGVRQFDAVARGELERELGLQCALDVEVELGLGQGEQRFIGQCAVGHGYDPATDVRRSAGGARREPSADAQQDLPAVRRRLHPPMGGRGILDVEHRVDDRADAALGQQRPDVLADGRDDRRPFGERTRPQGRAVQRRTLAHQQPHVDGGRFPVPDRDGEDAAADGQSLQVAGDVRTAHDVEDDVDAAPVGERADASTKSWSR